MRSHLPRYVSSLTSSPFVATSVKGPPIAAMPDVMTLGIGLTTRNATAAVKTPTAKSAEAKMIRNLSLLFMDAVVPVKGRILQSSESRIPDLDSACQGRHAAMASGAGRVDYGSPPIDSRVVRVSITSSDR